MTDLNPSLHDEPEYEGDDHYGGGGTRRLAIAAVVALALAGGAFFAGRAAAGGPSTLAEAVEQAQAGDLPCGDGAAAASPAGTPAPGAGTPPGAAGQAGNAGFVLRAVCQQGGQGGQGGQGTPGRGSFGGAGLGGQTGQVASVSGSTLTLQGPNGTTEVKLGSTTTINRSAKGDAGDLKAGQSVIVSGTGQNGQGAATSVLILPSGQGAG